MAAAVDVRVTNPQRRRRWFRFSLRTLLVVVTLIALWLGFFFNRAHDERRAAEALGEAHCLIDYDWQVRPDNDPNFKPTPHGPQWLRNLVGPHWFDRIVEVSVNEQINPSAKNDFVKLAPYLVKLQELRRLTLNSKNQSHDEYELLGRLTRIEVLRLFQSTKADRQDGAALARAVNIRELHIINAKLSADALKELAKLPNLEYLDISCSSFDSQTGQVLSEFQLRDDEAEALATFPRLRRIGLYGTQISDAGLKALCKLSQLESLEVGSPHITSATFDQVITLKHLRHLGTWGWKIDSADFDKLAQLPRLRSLGLVTTLNDESVPYVTQLRNLERLSLYGSQVTDASLSHFYALRNLQWLNLQDTSVDKKGEPAKELQRRMPNCIINLPRTKEEEEMHRAFINSKRGIRSQNN